MFSYVLLKSDVEILEKPLVFLRISASRAAAARMCPAWYYLTGMMALAGAQPLLQKFEAREKVARKSPFARHL